MRKIITLVLSAAILLVISIPAIAAEGKTGAEGEEISAQVLYDLGLFKGTEKGFELDRALNRAEGAVMLTRFLGGEQEAMTGRYKSPFTDLDDWMKPYLGWLYESGLANGTAAESYTPGEGMQYKHFMFLMQRTVGEGDNGSVLQAYLGVDKYDPIMDKVITRGQAVEIAQRVLSAGMNATDKTLARHLVDIGAVTAEKLDAVVTPVYGCDYYVSALGEDTIETQYMIRSVYGVTMAHSSITANAAIGTKMPYVRDSKPQELTAVFVQSGSDLYALDPQTLAHTKVKTLSDANPYWDVLGILPDAACLFIQEPDGSGSIYTYKGGVLSQAIENCWDGKTKMFSRDSVPMDGSLLLCGVFGAVRFYNDGHAEKLTDKPTEGVYSQDGEIYYMPWLTDAEVDGINDSYEYINDTVKIRVGFRPGGVELWRYTAKGEDARVFALDGKYGIMINDIVEIKGDVLRFKAKYTNGMYMTSDNGDYVYDLKATALTLVGFETAFPEYKDLAAREVLFQKEKERLAAII